MGLGSNTSLYTKSFRQNLKIWVRGYEEQVSVPDKPDIEKFRNYGKPVEDQVFWQEPDPDWDVMDARQKDMYAGQMWHMRLNGDWWLIGGKEIYIPGSAWFFFNAWTSELNNSNPAFRMEAVEYYWVAEHCCYYDPVCLGLLIVKPRRIGDTEKTLCLGTIFAPANSIAGLVCRIWWKTMPRIISSGS